MSKKFLVFDCETHNSGLEYSMPPGEFVRQMQYSWRPGEIEFTYDLEHMRSLIREADYVIGHNIISADLSWIFGPDSLEPLYMAMDHKVVDTFTVASLLTPAPTVYTDAKGHTYYGADKPGNALKWLSLSNLCHQFGLPGKFGDLSEIAKRYNPEGTLKRDLQYGLIDLQDEDFVEYSRQDIVAAHALYDYLMAELKRQKYSGGYVWREIEIASAMQQLSRNGILVNQEYAKSRIEKMSESRQELLDWLVQTHGFPTEGKSPWASAKGKEVILAVLAEFGITPETRPDWPRNKPTAKDPKGSLKLGGEDLLFLVEGAGEDAEEFGRALAELKGMRSIPQLVMDSMHPDGRIHMDVTSLQRSGRWSFTRPGITVVGSREGKDADKELFMADEGRVMAGFDFSNADPRAMAALSGDDEYARRFTELDPDTGKPYDGHNLTGEALFGKEFYYSRLDENGKPVLRPVSKAAGNALNYSIGPKKLAATLNSTIRKEKIDLEPFDVDDTRGMVDNFNGTYVMLKAFKDRAVRQGEEKGYVENSWGRRMPVDKDRAWTQAPSLYGQGTVREVMADAILRLIRRGEYYIRSLQAVIHDELLLSLDERYIERDIQVVKECMEVVFDPKTNVSLPLAFPVGHGFGRTWRAAGH